MWKFDVPVTGQPVIQMPTLARIKHIAHQPGADEGVIQMWALVDSDAPVHDRAFIITGTGYRVHPAWEHIGTAVTAAGMVWHVHEEVPF